MDVNQNENSFIINKPISEIISILTETQTPYILNSHYACKVQCEELIMTKGTIDGTYIQSGSIGGSMDDVDWIQGVMVGGDILNTTLDDKYPINYTTLLCSWNSVTNEIKKNINLNNNGFGYSYFYNLPSSIKECEINNGVFYNCNIGSIA